MTTFTLLWFAAALALANHAATGEDLECDVQVTPDSAVMYTCEGVDVESFPDFSPKATAIVLQANDIYEIFPVNFAEFPNLKLLQISFNFLTIIVNRTFSALTALNTLNLQKNEITMLQAGSFFGLSKLIKLVLVNNLIASFPSGLFAGLAELEELVIDQNILTYIGQDYFKGLLSLVELKLNNNLITGIAAESFDGLTKLEEMDLKDNQISVLSNGVLTNLSNVFEELVLRTNALTIIESHLFAGLIGFSELDLSNNQITCIDDSAFEDLLALETLFLNQNLLTFISSKLFHGLTALEKLILDDNMINVLASNAFAGLTSLVDFMFKRNPLECDVDRSVNVVGCTSCKSRLKTLFLCIDGDDVRCSDVSCSPTSAPTTSFPTHSPTLHPTTAPAQSTTLAPTSPPTRALYLKPECWEKYVVAEGKRLTRIKVFVGEPFVFEGFPQQGKCSDRSDIFGGGKAEQVLYEIGDTSMLEREGDGSVTYCRDSVTGRTTITAEEAGVYQFAFGATDQLDYIVNTFIVNIVMRPQFAIKQTSACNTEWVSTLATTFANISGSYDHNTVLGYDGFDFVKGCDKTDYFEHLRQDKDGNDVLTFSLVKGMRMSMPNTFHVGWKNVFVAPDSGRMFFQLDTIGFTNVTLLASTPLSRPIVLGILSLDVGARDDVNQTCGGHGVASDDGVQQDNKFLCRCDEGYAMFPQQPAINSTCVLIPASALAAVVTVQQQRSNTELVAVVVAVVVIAVVVMVVWRLQVYRLKYSAVDVSAIQLQLLADLGLAASVAIGSHEVAVNIAVNNHATEGELSDNELHQLQSLLVKLVAKRLLLPCESKSWVKAGPNPIQVFTVVFPKQPDYTEDDFARGVAKFDKEIQTANVQLNTLTITSAAVACAQRTPREIHRGNILRIAEVGGGNSSEVFKGELSENRNGHTLKIIVAVKALHSGSSEAAREDLLKEAALNALLDHRNVLSLLGVVTTPRDMSVFLVLAFCENGSLLDYLHSLEQGLPIHTKLTFCAEVARGLDYISARRVVHRDVAARNVLLDVSMVCKVADFGLSIALNESKEYARFDNGQQENELPVRWTAPEIFSESKFSVHSDVWSYGVFTWEVFSNGDTPYANLSVIEVVPYVRGGGQLPPLPSSLCPDEVNHNLILPCMQSKASDRPSFEELYEAAVYLGGSEDEVAITEKRFSRASQPKPKATFESTAQRLKMQGPSVYHLTFEFREKVFEAVASLLHTLPFEDLNHTSVEDCKVYHMVDAYVRPLTEALMCPRDGKQGVAYVDVLTSDDNVGVANALLSYSWGYKVNDVVDALALWTKSSNRNLKETYIWICSLCLNQHRIAVALSPDQLQAEFSERVLSIGHVLPMLEKWNDPGYIKRAWCLFELYTAIRLQSIQVDIILTTLQKEECAREIKQHGFRVVDQALGQVKSEQATATEAADLEAIRELILRYQGGFTALNRAVQVRLRSWFQNIAGIRFASQDGRQSASMSSSGIRASSSTSFESNGNGNVGASNSNSNATRRTRTRGGHEIANTTNAQRHHEDDLDNPVLFNPTFADADGKSVVENNNDVEDRGDTTLATDKLLFASEDPEATDCYINNSVFSSNNFPTTIPETGDSVNDFQTTTV